MSQMSEGGGSTLIRTLSEILPFFLVTPPLTILTILYEKTAFLQRPSLDKIIFEPKTTHSFTMMQLFLTILLACIAVAASSAIEGRELDAASDLYDRWFMEEPEIAYDPINNLFTLRICCVNA